MKIGKERRKNKEEREEGEIGMEAVSWKLGRELGKLEEAGPCCEGRDWHNVGRSYDKDVDDSSTSIEKAVRIITIK